MSFIRKRKRNGQIYLEEVENVRENGKVVQKFIRHVGREADGKQILSCSISEAEIESVRLSGPLMVLHSISESIGLPQTLGEYGNEILSMVYAHCLDYKSLNQMRSWFRRTDLNMILELEELTEKKLVSALDKIETMNLMEVQKAIFDDTKEFLGVNTKGVVYDVTNTYFHGRSCEIARYGHDKEKRKGYPLIQIGLAVTKELGIPIFHKTFPGNIHDSRTFLDVSRDLHLFGIKDGIAVMDRGISSADNTEFLSGTHWKVLCGLKADEGVKAALGKDFESRSLCRVKNRVQLNGTVFYCSEQSFRHGDIKGRLILCFNKRKANEMEEGRLDEVQAAHLRLQKGLTIKPDVQHFFGKDGRLLESRINEDRELDGMSFIFTTSNLAVADAVKAYFDKDVVEKSFQALKGVVRLRPVRHWLYNRVEAHVFICYLSCLLLTILKLKVAELGLSFQSALSELDGLYRVHLRDPKSGFKVGRLVALSRQQEKILRAVNKRLLKKCSGEN
jgi:transposase